MSKSDKKRSVAESELGDAKTPDAHKRRTQSHAQTPSDPNKKEGYSSDSSAGVVAHCEVQDLVLSVRESHDNSLRIFVSNSRPDTHLGSKQGDHVSAFVSFIQMLATVVEDENIKKVSHYLADVAKAVIPDKADIFDEIMKNFYQKAETMYSRVERKKLIAESRDRAEDPDKIERLKNSLKFSERALFRDVIQEMGEGLLKQMNLEEDMAFRKEGEADRAEGSRVKKAVHALKTINTTNRLLSKDVISGNELDFFFHDYVKTGAKCKDGLNAVLHDGGNGYTSSRVIRDWTQTETDKRGILEKINENSTPEKIAGFIGDLFDFQYEKHHSDNIRSLHKVTARHLVIMFHAFDQLQSMSSEDKSAVVKSFLQSEVLEKSGWNKRRGLDIDSLTEGITEHSRIDSGEFFMKSSREQAQMSGSSHRSRGTSGGRH